MAQNSQLVSSSTTSGERKSPRAIAHQPPHSGESGRLSHHGEALHQSEQGRTEESRSDDQNNPVLKANRGHHSTCRMKPTNAQKRRHQRATQRRSGSEAPTSDPTQKRIRSHVVQASAERIRSRLGATKHRAKRTPPERAGQRPNAEANQNPTLESAWQDTDQRRRLPGEEGDAPLSQRRPWAPGTLPDRRCAPVLSQFGGTNEDLF